MHRGTDYIGICGKPAEFRLWHTTVPSLASVFARILAELSPTDHAGHFLGSQ
eukprot:SAG31_NODE_33276_length_345_cov_1.621951_1_plen_51_part_10